MIVSQWFKEEFKQQKQYISKHLFILYNNIILCNYYDDTNKMWYFTIFVLSTQWNWWSHWFVSMSVSVIMFGKGNSAGSVGRLAVDLFDIRACMLGAPVYCAVHIELARASWQHWRQLMQWLVDCIMHWTVLRQNNNKTTLSSLGQAKFLYETRIQPKV